MLFLQIVNIIRLFMPKPWFFLFCSRFVDILCEILIYDQTLILLANKCHKLGLCFHHVLSRARIWTDLAFRPRFAYVKIADKIYQCQSFCPTEWSMDKMLPTPSVSTGEYWWLVTRWRRSDLLHRTRQVKAPGHQTGISTLGSALDVNTSGCFRVHVCRL